MSKLETFGKTSVLFVMAVEAEYGAHLQQQFTPLFTGVGPVEGAVITTRALTEMHAAGTLPDLVVSLGSAGSARLNHTAVYQASRVSYRDMDAQPLGFEKGATPFLDQPVAIPLPLQIPDLPTATLSTGANVVSGAGYDAIDADMVDMETFAVLRACQQFSLPLVALRGISDGKSELEAVSDWTAYLHVVDENLSKAVSALRAMLS